VSHLGFIVMGIFAFTPEALQGATFQMLSHGISTGTLFLLVGALHDRRHTFRIADYGGLATPMPVFAAFFLFISLASAGLPMLNGFVGEFLILMGTFERHAAWASWAAAGVILSAIYLLWAYQRVFFGPINNEHTRDLRDADLRERLVLFAMAALILWMGIGSASFTRRSEASVQHVLELMQRPQSYDARTPLPAVPQASAIEAGAR
jgi:NADH-quinone oxidoreductase subunit M